mgnify:CR=1 FL=1
MQVVLVKQGLEEAIRNAPEILFVAAAGNSDDNNAFTEDIPSSFDLPNLLTVGAVDQAGDETSFTSFGRVAVYASGYEVESVVPGGGPMKMSGTSMASPGVANLAAKLWAVMPQATVAEVKAAIENGATEKKVPRGTIKLVHPKRSMLKLLGAN